MLCIINVFSTVQEMYAFCHEALADYVDSFETQAKLSKKWFNETHTNILEFTAAL